MDEIGIPQCKTSFLQNGLSAWVFLGEVMEDKEGGKDKETINNYFYKLLQCFHDSRLSTLIIMEYQGSNRSK